MDDKKAKRASPISYRPPEHLRAEFEQRVKLSELSTNAFLTEAWHGRSRHRPDENIKLAKLLGLCAIISDRVLPDQPAGDGQSSSTQQQIAEELQLIRTVIMQRLGRRS